MGWLVGLLVASQILMWLALAEIREGLRQKAGRRDWWNAK